MDLDWFLLPCNGFSVVSFVFDMLDVYETLNEMCVRVCMCFQEL